MLPERCPFITMPALRQRKASLLPSTDANPLRKHMCSEHTSAPANSKAAGAHGPLSSPSGGICAPHEVGHTRSSTHAHALQHSPKPRKSLFEDSTVLT